MNRIMLFLVPRLLWPVDAYPAGYLDISKFTEDYYFLDDDTASKARALLNADDEANSQYKMNSEGILDEMSDDDYLFVASGEEDDQLYGLKLRVDPITGNQILESLSFFEWEIDDDENDHYFDTFTTSSTYPLPDHYTSAFSGTPESNENDHYFDTFTTSSSYPLPDHYTPAFSGVPESDDFMLAFDDFLNTDMPHPSLETLASAVHDPGTPDQESYTLSDEDDPNIYETWWKDYINYISRDAQNIDQALTETGSQNMVPQPSNNNIQTTKGQNHVEVLSRWPPFHGDGNEDYIMKTYGVNTDDSQHNVDDFVWLTLDSPNEVPHAES